MKVSTASISTSQFPFFKQTAKNKNNKKGFLLMAQLFPETAYFCSLLAQPIQTAFYITNWKLSVDGKRHKNGLDHMMVNTLNSNLNELKVMIRGKLISFRECHSVLQSSWLPSAGVLLFKNEKCTFSLSVIKVTSSV